ncbi:MAG: AsmA family protein [Gammaproteobacteria bacterium]
MKSISLISRTIGIIVLLGIGAIGVVVHLMDASEYKSEISALVARHFERELDLQGDLEITFFPWLGMRAGRLTLSEHADFGDETMFTAERASFRIKLLPLLRKRFEIDRITFDRPRLHLRRRADGAANWDDLLATFGLERKRAPAAAGLAGLVVLGIKIEDGGVTWRDRSGGIRDFTVDALRLRAGTLTPGMPSKIELSARIKGLLPQPAALTLKTSALLSRDLKTASLNGSDLRVAGKTANTNVRIETISYSRPDGRGELQGIAAKHQRDGATTRLRAPSLAFNLSEKSFRLPEIELAQDDFETRGTMYGARLATAPEFSARLRVRAGDVADVLRRHGFAFRPPLRIDDFDGGFDARMKDGAIDIHFLTADLAVNHHPSKLTASDFHFDLTAIAPRVTFGNFTLTQDDFFLRADGALPARGLVAARSDDIETWLARNALVVELPRGLSGGVDVQYRFEYADGWLAVYDMKGAADGGRVWQAPHAEFPATDFAAVVEAVLQARQAE